MNGNNRLLEFVKLIIDKTQNNASLVVLNFYCYKITTNRLGLWLFATVVSLFPLTICEQ